MQTTFRLVLALCLTVSWALIAGGGTPASQQSSPPAQASQQPPAGQANPQTQKPAQAAITPEEREANLAIQNELDPDKQLKLVDDFVKKFPNSVYLSDVYFYGAVAAEQKTDLAKVLDYGEKSLNVNSNNLRSLITMATILPQPQSMQGSDAEKEKKLTEAETDANRALQLIPQQVVKQPNQTDEQVQKTRSALSTELHSALGMVHLQRALMGLSGADAGELAKAEQEYKLAVSGTDRPEPQDYYRLGEVYKNENKVDEGIDAFSKASQSGKGSPIEALADKEVEKLKQKKSQLQAPAKP